MNRRHLPSRRWLFAAALLGAISCHDGDRRSITGPGLTGGEPVSLISDGAHSGIAGFYFLPPVTAQPSVTGVFDADIATLQPVVAICEVTSTPIVACGASTSGATPALRVFTTSGVPAIVLDAGKYKVDWDTGEPGFEAGHVYRIFVFAGSSRSELGFADALLTAVPGQVTNTDGETIVLKDGRTLPIHFRIEQGIVLGPGPAASLEISGLPASVVSGSTASITVTARDVNGNVASGYAGTIAFTSTDPESSLPDEYTFTAEDAGTRSFPASVILRTAGSTTVTATDQAASTISGAQTVTVTPAAATKLVLSGIPASTTSGAAHDLTVTAQDEFGNTATGYDGTVRFTSSDAAAALPEEYAFQASDAGVKTFAGGVTLRTAGAQTVRAEDGDDASIFGEVAVTLGAGDAVALTVTGLDDPTVAGTAGSITVTARDANGNVATGYAGTIAFASTDPLATLPDMYTFASGDAGTHTFSGAVVLRTAGSITVTATDQATSSITGAQSVSVTPAAAAALVLGGIPASTTAGLAHDLTVTAKDEFGNVATGYAGTVQFISTDDAATIPPAYTFQSTDAGVRTFAGGVIFRTAGPQTFQATDAAVPALTASVMTNVGHGPASQLRFTVQPTSVLEGRTIEPPVVVTTYDAFDNLADTFAGQVSVAIGTNPGGGVLSGTLQVNAAAGVATFADLRISVAGNGYTLVASAAGLTSATSAPFNIIAIDVHWINAAGGSWTTGSNWSTGAPPAQDQTALIDLAGTYTVTLNADVTVNALSVGAGSGVQTLAVSSARTLTVLTSATVLGTGALVMNGATLAGSGTLTVAHGGSLQLNAGAAVQPSLVNAGTLLATGAPDVNGSLSTTTSSVIRVLSVGFGGSHLTVAGGFTNNGTVDITANVANGSGLTVNGTLVNAAGAFITVTGTAGGRTLNTDLDNRGTMTVDVTLSLGRVNATWLNSGLIHLRNGSLQTVQRTSFTNTGTLTVNAGRSWTISGATFTQAPGATLNGGGAMILSGGNTAAFETAFTLGSLTVQSSVATFATDISTETLALSLAGATFNGPGTLTNAADRTLNITSSEINTALVNHGTVVAIGNSDFNGSVTTVPGSLIQARSVGFGGTNLTVANGFTNYGTLEMTATVTNGCNLIVNGTLVNAPGGTIRVTGTAGGRTLNTQLDNQGTITVEVGLTLARAGSRHLNSGVIDLTGGNLFVDQGGTTPTFTNSGTVTVSSGLIWLVDTGPVTNAAGAIIQGGGRFETGNTASLTNAGSVTVALARIGDGFTSTGTFAPTTVEFFGNATTIPVGAGYSYNNVNVISSASFAGSVGIAANLTVAGSGNLNIGGNQITVGGNFATQNTSVLTMQNAAGVLDVAGAATFGGASTNTRLTMGTLRVGGNFAQAGNAAAFAASGSHLTILDGSGAQTVSFANSGTATTTSHFQRLEIENTSTSGVTLGTAVFANGQLRTPAGVTTRTVTGNGHTLQVGGLDAAGLVFDNTPLRVVDGEAITRFDDATFRNMNTAATQLRLDRSSDVVTFNAITFETVPSAGLYLHLVDTDAGTSLFTVTMQGTRPANHGGFVFESTPGQLIGWPM